MIHNNSDDLSEQALTAYVLGYRYIEKNSLQSEWSATGFGWQEHWQSTSAGLYASCDGLLALLREVPSSSLRLGGDYHHSLVDAVFTRHVLRIFDPSVPAKTESQRRVRRVCRGTTTKIAKFLQTVAFLRSSRFRFAVEAPEVVKVVSDQIQKIDKLLDTPGAELPAQIGEHRWNALAATCESLIALSAYCATDKRHLGIKNSIQQKADELGWTVSNAAPQKSLIAAWTLTELWPILTRHQKSIVVNALEHWAPSLMRLRENPYAEFFPTPEGSSDYYHLDPCLLGGTALLRMLRQREVDEEFFSKVSPPVCYVVDRMLKQDGQFSYRKSTRRPAFWQHSQALNFLAEFLWFHRDHPRQGRARPMYITPQQFYETEFKIRTDLAVVLMPLEEEWSQDVFNTFSKACELNDLKAWKSDLYFRDDQIMQTVWRFINQAKLVIAECTGRNPNVFYELGIAHTIGKNVFICAQDRRDIPFDLASIRSWEYGTPIPANLNALSDYLSNFIAEHNDD